MDPLGVSKWISITLSVSSLCVCSCYPNMDIKWITIIYYVFLGLIIVTLFNKRSKLFKVTMNYPDILFCYRDELILTQNLCHSEVK